jgi:hypothetical protein
LDYIEGGNHGCHIHLGVERGLGTGTFFALLATVRDKLYLDYIEGGNHGCHISLDLGCA